MPNTQYLRWNFAQFIRFNSKIRVNNPPHYILHIVYTLQLTHCIFVVSISDELYWDMNTDAENYNESGDYLTLFHTGG